MGAHRPDDDTPMSLRKGTQNQINGPYRYETSGDSELRVISDLHGGIFE